MAVQAQRLNVFSSLERQTMDDVIGAGNANLYGTVPLNTVPEQLLPMYCSSAVDYFPAKNAMKCDSGVTYTLPPLKRPREEITPVISYPAFQSSSNRCGSMSFLGEDISIQIQQQQLDVDRFIAQHMEKVRMEIEERRRRYARSIVAAVEEGIRKRLKTKEDEIESIGKLNWALEERVKSLCVENQIWRDLAQTNEATANALRSNLEQVLAQVHDGGARRNTAAEMIDDAESCCSSNHQNDDNDEDTAQRNDDVWGRNGQNGESNGRNRLCRNCGKAESCVLLLPCRHLCLCTACGSSILTCPICKSTKNASLRVNFSS